MTLTNGFIWNAMAVSSGSTREEARLAFLAMPEAEQNKFVAFCGMMVAFGRQSAEAQFSVAGQLVPHIGGSLAFSFDARPREGAQPVYLKTTA